MATIKDVAKLAGISVATVSNAINGKRGVKAHTRAMVLDAARQLRYTPNAMAQGLVTGSFTTIGIVLSGPASFNVLTNQSILQMIQISARTINAAGYAILLSMADFTDDRDIAHSLRHCKQCDGLILVDTRSSDAVIADFLSRLSIPAVVTLRPCPLDTFPSMGVDNIQCGFIATRHLIEFGHRRIAYVGRMPGVGPAELRLYGYKNALRESNIHPEPAYILPGDHYQESGRLAAEDFLRIASPRPTAIVAGNDLMALGAIEVLQREGVRVPEDVSIVGCDNLPNMHMLRVPLTSVAIPFEHIGQLSAQGILDMVRIPHSPCQSVMLPPELRVRGSVCSLL